MTYFVNVFFQQKDGVIGHISSNFTDINTARMEYHAQLAAQYNPANSIKNKWATVQLIQHTGYIILSETATFEDEEAPNV